MQSDTNSMAEKILRDIESAINRDIDEFIIIPVDLNQNKSPVIQVENNLGLESWCVKHIYNYAYKKTLDLRKLISKHKLLHEEYSSVNCLLIGVLLINPDVSTFWNIRRELICDNILTVQSELKFAKIVLSHKSKSNEAFSYRKWLISRILNSDSVDKSILCSILTEEFKVCNVTSQKSANNYHAWCHRTWCIENILKHAADDFIESVLLSELNYSESWVSKHISEHTGFYYRQFIIKQLINTNFNLENKYYEGLTQFFTLRTHKSAEILTNLLGKAQQQWHETDLHLFHNSLLLLIYEITLNFELNNLFLEHETLWYHRRFILHELYSLIYRYHGILPKTSNTNLELIFANDKCENNVVDNLLVKDNGEKCPKMLKCETNFIHSSKLYQFLVENERKLIDKCSKMLNRQNYLAQRHEKWLVYILELTNM